MSKRPEFVVTGRTQDGKLVIGGVFRFVGEQGIPLDLIVSFLNEHNLMLDWLDFLRDSEKEGWPRERTIHRLQETVGDVYGPEWAAEWSKRMATIRGCV